jgi:molybdopterin-guanine dinucleotide biosynthesis protein A
MEAIILAGGRSTRMGRDKALLTLAGSTLLQRALDACSGCRTIVVVAPEASAVSLGPRPGLVVTLEDPPFGGPVAGIAAGLAALAEAGPGRDDPWVLLLSVDLVRPAAVVAALLAAERGAAERGAADGICLSDGTFAQHLAAMYHREALSRAVAAVETRNCSVKRLMAPLTLAVVVVPEALTADLDTPQDAVRHALD